MDPKPPEPDTTIVALARAAQAAISDREERVELARVYQLAFWPDDERAMPGDFIACALFGAIQGRQSDYVTLQRLASINGLSVIFTGTRLTQVHADVWQGIMHLARQQPEGSLVRFRGTELLRLIGRHTGKAQRDQLKRWISQLAATNVQIQDDAKKRRFGGSLLPWHAEQDHDDQTLFAVEISRDLARVLSSGFGVMDWRQRVLLKNKPLALWLQTYFSRFRRQVGVSQLHALSGSGATLKEFRRHLRAALDELHSVGGHAARVDAETDTVIPDSTRLPRQRRPRRDQPQLPLPLHPGGIPQTKKF